MTEKKEYTIQYSGLAEKSYNYSFVIGKVFFEDFNYTDVSDANIVITVHLEKHERMMVFLIVAEGVAEVLCDRCNEPFLLPIHQEFRLIAKISDEYDGEDDEIVFLASNAYEIDLKQHFFDFLALQIPIRKTHNDSADGSKCNVETISILNRLTPENNDNRWNELKKIKFDN
ncbi:MAG: DUF177 domain-containing protein [Bacteroidales bacterium]|nr:DUF177 domain-containing protein [Bacteroidales bacterium]